MSPRTGRPVSTGRGKGSPQTVVRWSPEEFDLVVAWAGEQKNIAGKLRSWALRQARRK